MDQLTNVLMPLLGVVVGGLITFTTQSIMTMKQIKRDKEREDNVNNLQRLKVYSDILKIDGEFTVCNLTEKGVEFETTVYYQELRGSLYSHFYLLHPTISHCVREIDKVLSQISLEMYMGDKENDSLVSEYQKLIGFVEDYLDKARKLL